MKTDIKTQLKTGYDRLVGFETTTKGYEWIGKSPGHEALTGYGLAQFAEMSQVVDFVEASAVQRNREWLMQRRDGKGYF